MRIAELRLLAYGHFTQRTLSFGEPGRLEIVLGANEAGKSTTLRAVKGLLFGIEERTPDDFLHSMKDLRVGARLVGAGAPLDVVRRKGRKDTLLGAGGEPIGDDALVPLLGGITREVFETTFGLDPTRLREGAEGLLRDEGELGKTLFSAAVGATHLSKLRASLEKQAGDLFKATGTKGPLNQALAALAQARKDAREKATRPEVWEDQMRALEARRAERAELQERRSLRGAEAQLVERLEVALREESEVRARVTSLTESLTTLEQRRGELVVEEELLLRDADLTALHARLGAHQKMREDLPKRIAELRAAEEAAKDILVRSGWPTNLAAVTPLRISEAESARIRSLAQERAAVRDRLAQARKQLEASRAALGEVSEPEDGPTDVAALERALADARARGDLDRAVTQAERAARRAEADLVARLQGLGLDPSLGAVVRALPVPAKETIEERAREEAERAATLQRLAEREAEVADRTLRTATELDALRREGTVPTEDDLSTARKERDEAIVALEANASAERVAAARQLVARADEVADRLRREGDRVARLARLLAEQGALEERRTTLEKERSEHEARIREADRAWTSVWARVPVDVRSGAAMREWYARFSKALEAAEEALARRDAEEEALAARSAECESLRRALAPAAQVAEGASLGELVALAEARLARHREAATSRALVERERREVGMREAAVAEAERDTAAWQARWREAVVPLGLGDDATTEETEVVLRSREQIFRHVDDAQKLARRIADMQADGEAFAADVRALASAVAPSLQGADPVDTATQLFARLTRAREASTERTSADEQLAARRAEQARELARLDACAARVAELRAEGGPSTASLVDSAHAAARLEELRAEIETLDHDLRQIAHTVGGLEAGMKQIGGEALGAIAEADLAEAMARVRELAERTARLRLASAVLRREMTRYQSEHQGPVLARASELFGVLTRGGFRGLRAGFGEDDDRVLVGVRDDGKDVRVPGMSEGTRDQLYLALRIASLERMGHSLPLLLDDVLVHFDNPRAGAALEVLASLAERMQVLLFTHHEHIVALAREVLPPDRLQVLELG